MPRAVLFDLDDTLFDHRHCARTALEAIRTGHRCFETIEPSDFEQLHAGLLEELHVRVLSKELELDVAREERFRRLFAAADFAADRDLVRATAAAYRESYLTSRRAVPGSQPLLAALRGQALVGVVSNNLLQEQLDKVRFCSFEPYIHALVVSEEVGVAKPDPEIFEIALRRLACEPDDAVMVGDSWQTDIQGARAAGIRAIWFNRTGADRPDDDPAITEIRTFEPLDAVLPILLSDTRVPAR